MTKSSRGGWGVAVFAQQKCVARRVARSKIHKNSSKTLNFVILSVDAQQLARHSRSKIPINSRFEKSVKKLPDFCLDVLHLASYWVRRGVLL
ncbi:hypothetical protein DMC01_09890 [Campylobacter troglodytis]|nr:hypothetical protein DMC01_09890 [Campylobacter troglodytis]